MLIEINDTKTIGEIQDEFSGRYPFLRIEFFKNPHRFQQSSSPADRLPSTQHIGEIRAKHEPGIMEIYSWLTPSMVERTLERNFGLFIQVCRRHNNEWVQTAGTDSISLREQNETGRNASIGSERPSPGKKNFNPQKH